MLGPPLEHFLEKFPFASARITAMHFNASHSTRKDIWSRALGLRKLSRRSVPHQLSGLQKMFRIDTLVKLFTLLDQYCELPFEGIATGEELCACELI
jgi:hypothetical protein